MGREFLTLVPFFLLDFHFKRNILRELYLLVVWSPIWNKKVESIILASPTFSKGWMLIDVMDAFVWSMDVQLFFCRHFLFTFVRVIPNLTKLTTNSFHDLDVRRGGIARRTRTTATAVLISTRIVSKIPTHSFELKNTAFRHVGISKQTVTHNNQKPKTHRLHYTKSFNHVCSTIHSLNCTTISNLFHQWIHDTPACHYYTNYGIVQWRILYQYQTHTYHWLPDCANGEKWRF